MDYRLEVVSQFDPNLEPGLFVQCLRLRQEVFVSQMGWNLREVQGCEFDQYDTPAAYHLAAVSREGQVVGCMRMLRTDNDQGTATYMILDAHRGLIPNLPSSIMDREIVSSKTWEASRLAISHLVERKDRNALCVAFIRAAIEFISERGGDELLGMMNPVFERLFRRAGLPVERFGPIQEQRDGAICVLKLNWNTDQAVIAASPSRSTYGDVRQYS